MSVKTQRSTSTPRPAVVIDGHCRVLLTLLGAAGAASGDETSESRRTRCGVYARLSAGYVISSESKNTLQFVCRASFYSEFFL